ncbi:MAG: S8 family serine peptidase, partial [Nevskiaceae bacterium]
SNPSSDAAGGICGTPVPPCDHYELTVELPADYASTNPTAAIRVEAGWPNAAEDFDFYLLNPDDTVKVSGATAGNPEVMQIAAGSGSQQYRIRVIPYAVAGGTASVTVTLLPQVGGGSGGACDASGEANGGSALIDAGILDDWQSLSSGATYGAFVHFNMGKAAQQDAILAALGLTRLHDFRKYSRSVFVTGPVAAFQALARVPSVARLEHNRPLRYYGNTAVWSTRARVAQEEVVKGPYYDAAGNLLTGADITLGAIDDGLNATHPDFQGRVLHNNKLIDPLALGPAQYQDVGEADSTNPGGGHGTHVMGIVAGGGAMSDGGYPVAEAAPNIKGTFTGLSPESPIIAWGNGAALFVLSVDLAYQNLLDNLDGYSPALRAVNNSYGSAGGEYNPGDTSNCLINEIIERNVVMVFAAGNDGGAGSGDEINNACKNPTPGLICVASHNDKGTGDRSAPISTFSSRGHIGNHDTYPDISAPGDLYTSTCGQATPTQAICTGGDDSAAETEWQPWYGTISGTSMATPHVTGALGLIFQARPDLTPAQVEKLLQDTAVKIGEGYENDPQNAGGTHHFAYGAGLMDLPAALDALGVASQGLPAVDYNFTIFDGDEDASVAGAADVVRLTMQNTLDGATGESGVQMRLTVRDGADLGSNAEIAYRVELNADGRAFATTVVATADGVAPAEADEITNTAVASSVMRDGNLISLFVPYSQLGFAPINSPLHNIGVVVSDALGAPLDVAPSAQGSSAQTAALMPMHGRAFTTRLVPATPPPSNETSCLLPGLTRVTSPVGTTGDASGTGWDDLRRVYVAEPPDLPGKLVFTIVTGANTPLPPPSYRFYVYFKVPGSDQDKFVAMDTVAPGSSATPRFVYGFREAISAPAATVGVFTVEGEIDAASNMTGEGVITLVVDKALYGLTTGGIVTAIGASLRQTSNPENGAGLTVDSSSAVEPYLILGHELCLSEPPIAIAGADFSIAGGGTVTLSAAGSSDPEGGELSYFWTQTAGPSV